jgi:hypothetical protein
MYMIIPLLPLLPLFPFPLTWNPPCCDRIHPPLPWVARKLTPVFPSPAHLAPCPESRPPGVFPGPNRHSLGRHCEPNPYACLQVLYLLVFLLIPCRIRVLAKGYLYRMLHKNITTIICSLVTLDQCQKSSKKSRQTVP